MSTEIISIQRKKLSEMTDEEINISKYRSLEARYNSVMEAVEKIEDQNKKFREEIEICYRKVVNADKNVDINKAIVMKLITESNEDKQSYLGEISDLKAALRAK